VGCILVGVYIKRRFKTLSISTSDRIPPPPLGLVCEGERDEGEGNGEVADQINTSTRFKLFSVGISCVSKFFWLCRSSVGVRRKIGVLKY
jgi:hypothetical protein